MRGSSTFCSAVVNYSGRAPSVSTIPIPDETPMTPNTILWIYIILILAGGLMGFFKAGSKVSLMTSAISAAALVLTTIGLFGPAFSRGLADAIMAALLVVFA